MPLPSHLVLALSAAIVSSGGPGDALNADAATRTVAVFAMGDPFAGPSPEAAAALGPVRAALQQQGAQVLEREELRARLGVADPDPTDLERTYAGAQAAYQADELDTAVRLFRAVIAEIERRPSTDGTYDLWVRAHLRVALTERARSRSADAREAMERILALEPGFVVDPDQFAPAFRREFEEARRALERSPRRELRVGSDGPPVAVRVDGRPAGTTPVAVALPPGRYRVSGSLVDAATRGRTVHVPSVVVELGAESALVTLDAGLAEAVRLERGPGIEVAREGRGAVLGALGAWLRIDRVVGLRLVREGDTRRIEASAYDVPRGTIAAEAQVPLVDGAIAPESARVLASFLLTGERPLRVPELAGGRPRHHATRWLRPAAYAAGIAALGAGTFALLQARSSQDRSGEAAAMVRPDGALVAGTDRARYDAVVAGADSATRNAYVGAAGAAALAMAAGVLGYLSLDARGPALGPAIRF